MGALTRRLPASRERHPLLPALLAQVYATLLAGLLMLLIMPPLLAQPFAAAMLQGFIAALVSWRQRAPNWWLAIHLSFVPMLVLARSLELPNWFWPAGLAMLLLTFWRTDRGRVPLYLSNRASTEALLKLLPPTPCRVIDLGCGDGAVLRKLARARPDSCFVGIEHAPLPWFWAWLAARGQQNLSIRFGDYWAHPLSAYAVVYAFLSPAAMPRLWAKAHAEMSAGAILASNSFAVPGQPAHAELAPADGSRDRIYLYQPGTAAIENQHGRNGGFHGVEVGPD